ncbi:hypothetical protein DM02DRAFT_204137 [Periconia macrospinosa]|uniref:F-box domain-containing protein n=1 Tax=Periconia macrospinosa TaxID=97972 RepID=A0A2V1DAE4_9PLEO|nr:hypothetical protein DM02DRAFT_204137 [Periconia macrospinosa]
MVNSKHAVFKVNKQTPAHGPPPQAYSTVINCRKHGGKRAKDKKDMRARVLRFAKIPGVPCVDKLPPPQSGLGDLDDSAPPDGFTVAKITPTKLRRGKTAGKGIDLDSWFTILTFSAPAQLLEMRTKIASCYRFLRDNPMLWKHSRENYYRGTLPDLPSELTEFQYAHLRHGHGCMSCGTPSTRKTYWAFLRRWCKNCLHSKIMKESDALPTLKDSNGEDISFLQKCLPSGIFDSWGNFVGVGPATTLSYKTVFLTKDVEKIINEYNQEKEANGPSWTPGAWMVNKIQVVDERRQFARKMELWEDSTRQNKSFEHLEKKQARKVYFAEKASQLVPPIAVREMECCPSYRRAIAIPKEPNMTSWLQLKPKLEKEAADLRARGGAQLPTFSVSGSSTPSTDFY